MKQSLMTSPYFNLICEKYDTHAVFKHTWELEDICKAVFGENNILQPYGDRNWFTQGSRDYILIKQTELDNKLITLYALKYGIN